MHLNVLTDRMNSSLMRILYRELRPTVREPQKHVYETSTWKYITSLCRRTDITSFEITHLTEKTAPLYISYLRGNNAYGQILKSFKGKGERSAQDSAEIMGFKMPNQ